MLSKTTLTTETVRQSLQSDSRTLMRIKIYDQTPSENYVSWSHIIKLYFYAVCIIFKSIIFRLSEFACLQNLPECEQA